MHFHKVGLQSQISEFFVGSMSKIVFPRILPNLEKKKLFDINHISPMWSTEIISMYLMKVAERRMQLT